MLDVRGLTNLTDYYVLATGNNQPHIKALASELERGLRAEGTRRYRVAGKAESEWVAMDFIDAVIHIFSPEARTYYALEELWNDAERV